VSADIAPVCARVDADEALFVLFGALLLDHAPPWYAYLLPIELQSVLRRDSEAKRVAACVRGGLFYVAAASLEAWAAAADADLDSAIAFLQRERSEVAGHVAAAMLSAKANRLLTLAGARSVERIGIWGVAEMDARDSRLTHAEQTARAAGMIVETFARFARELERVGVL
jgi:hypothetical protein